MKQKGAVLLTTVVVLSMMALLSAIHLQTININQKITFAHNMYDKSRQAADNSAADVFERIINSCQMIDRAGTHRVDESTQYSYSITDYVDRDNIYVLQSTATTLQRYSATVSIGFRYDFQDKQFNPNNGWGNGDQDAPGNSGDKNNAENSDRDLPKGLAKNRYDDDDYDRDDYHEEDDDKKDKKNRKDDDDRDDYDDDYEDDDHDHDDDDDHKDKDDKKDKKQNKCSDQQLTVLYWTYKY